MAEEKQHHRGLFHHNHNENQQSVDDATNYSETAYSTGGSGGYDQPNYTGGGGAYSADVIDGGGYGESKYSSGGGTYSTGGGYGEKTGVYGSSTGTDQVDYNKEEMHHKHLQQIGELGTVAAGAYAMYEKHEAKKDPENAHRHKIEEEIAAVGAVGAGGFAFHEHHQNKETKKEEEEAHGKKHHHLF